MAAQKYVTVGQFAQMAGVHRQAIYNKLKTGALIKRPDGKLDITHPLNIEYLNTDHKEYKNRGAKPRKPKEQKLRIPKPVPPIPPLKKYVSQVEFAKMCKVSASAIQHQTKRGGLVKDAKGKIDITHPVNAQYLKVKKGFKPPELIIKEEERNTILVPGNSMKQEKEKETVRKLWIHNNKQLGLLVDRELVKKYFGEMGAVIINYLFPIGNRLAPGIAGICEINDPVIIKQIEELINQEIMKGLKEFKKVCGDF